MNNFPQVEIIGKEAFRLMKVKFLPGQVLLTEPGSMASQDSNLKVSTLINGNFFSALVMNVLGGESFFINEYKNDTNSNLELYLTQSTPGEILKQELNGETIFIERGSFIARTPQVSVKTVWAGFSSWIAGEGLFRLALNGSGSVWFGAFGAVVEKEIAGDLIVDSGHLLSYPSTVSLSLKLPSGLISSFLSKEGFVLHLKGEGKVTLQTRSVKGLAQWLNGKFW